MEVRLRRRVRLKQKEANRLRDALHERLGGSAWPDGAAIETADAGGHEVILVNGKIHGLRDEAGPMLSVRGLLAARPDGGAVTVDMGAVKFVYNGADVMSPGIVAADEALQEGDWCWVRDEKNGQPLAVGKCLMPGADMAAATSGKAVASVHHIGDALWLLDE